MLLLNQTTETHTTDSTPLAETGASLPRTMSRWQMPLQKQIKGGILTDPSSLSPKKGAVVAEEAGIGTGDATLHVGDPAVAVSDGGASGSGGLRGAEGGIEGRNLQEAGESVQSDYRAEENRGVGSGEGEEAGQQKQREVGDAAAEESKALERAERRRSIAMTQFLRQAPSKRWIIGQESDTQTQTKEDDERHSLIFQQGRRLLYEYTLHLSTLPTSEGNTRVRAGPRVRSPEPNVEVAVVATRRSRSPSKLKKSTFLVVLILFSGRRLEIAELLQQNFSSQ